MLTIYYITVQSVVAILGTGTLIFNFKICLIYAFVSLSTICIEHKKILLINNLTASSIRVSFMHVNHRTQQREQTVINGIE